MAPPEPQRTDAVAFLDALSPWPERFGLEGMKALLAELGEPQRRYPAIHVVGTNGKTSTTLMTAALLRAAGFSVGVTISPHLRSWSERIQLDGREADFDAALARVRPHAEGATQFEIVIAAALAEFAARRVDVAVVEAGLGGRLDATNVLDARVVALTNVALEHTAVLGPTREAIAVEKLAVVADGATVLLGEAEWEPLARAAGAGRVLVESGGNAALARAAAEAFAGTTLDPAPAQQLRVPGRLERRPGPPAEIRDGAHNPAGLDYLRERLGPTDATIVASILADKDVEAMLERLAGLGSTLVATASHSARAVPAAELAQRASEFFARVEALADPHAALARARSLAGAEGLVLVTGSLYLLGDLSNGG